MVLKIIGIILGVLVLLLILVVLLRTLMFKPPKKIKEDPEPIEFDTEKSRNNLISLIQCKTVSYEDESKEDEKEFEKFFNLLPSLYPNVYENCPILFKEKRAILYHWKGKSSSKPTVLMAHFDVVPVDMDKWSVDPFEGIIKNGCLYGRGSLDTKVTFNGVMYACDKLISEGFIPENDIYMAFSGGEEIDRGCGAQDIIGYLTEHNIKPHMVLDEGGAVVENVFPGVKGKCAVVGTSEKGLMDLRWTVKSNGGHASAPTPNSPIVKLSRAVLRVEKHPLKCHMTKPTLEMFDTLGRHSTFLYRMIFSNLWLFSGILDSMAKKSGGNMNALQRTTIAFTQAKGSNATNVIPPEASITTNIRINPCDTSKSVVGEIKKIIKDDDIELEILHVDEASSISKTDCIEWEKVKTSIEETWKDVICSPYLMVACSDARHYSKICDKVYRFSSYDVTDAELSTIHGNDERINLESLKRSQEFFIRLIKKL